MTQEELLIANLSESLGYNTVVERPEEVHNRVRQMLEDAAVKKQSKDVSIDMVPFWAKTLVQNKNLLPDIDAIYEKNKYTYYQAAKASPWYVHGIAEESILKTERYYRKIAGIFTCAENGNKEAKEAIMYLFKKGYRRIYNLFKGHTEVSFKDFIRVVENNYKDLKIEDCSNMVCAFLYFVHTLEVKVSDLDNIVTRAFLQLDDFYAEDSKRRINIEKLMKKHPELKIAIEDDREDLNKGNYYEVSVTADTPYSYLFDMDRLSLTQIMQDADFTQKDLDEIALAYEIRKTTGYDIEYTDYIVPALYIRAVCKEYRRAKELYFKDNEERAQLQLHETEEEFKKVLSDKNEENSKLKDRVDALNNEKDKLYKELEQLKRENERLRTQSSIEKAEKEELHSLREFAYQQMEKEENLVEEQQIPYEELLTTKCVVIGGHDNFTQKLKKYLPKWTFISPNSSFFDAKLLQNADHIFIFADYCNHPLYHRAISSMPERKNSFSYLSTVNVKKTLSTIAETLGIM